MDIIGHESIRKRLRHVSVQETCPQAYLFSGPEGVGKKSVAFEFAELLLCLSRPLPRNEHGDIEHPDVVFIAPPVTVEKGRTKTKAISLETIREAARFLSRYPSEGARRILIIDDAHRLSRGAQNALLKTLEEPNPTSILILVTSEKGLLLETVLSRLAHISFGIVSPHDMERFESVIDFPVPSFFRSLGSPGVLSQFREQPKLFREVERALTALFSLSKLSLSERLHLAEDLSKNTPFAIRLLEWWGIGLRRRALEGLSMRQCRGYFLFLERILETVSTLKGTQANARLTLEKLFLSIAS